MEIRVRRDVWLCEEVLHSSQLLLTTNSKESRLKYGEDCNITFLATFYASASLASGIMWCEREFLVIRELAFYMILLATQSTKVEESDLPDESSSSLQSFDDASSVLYAHETLEAFDDSGVHDVKVVTRVPQRYDVGSPTAMKNRSYYHLKPSARQFMDGVRAVEHVGSKYYRTPHGFQKEATFPCRPLVAHTYSPSSSEGRSARLFVSTNSGKRGPLERFTLMIGENILHFRIVKAPVEQSCLDEPRSTSSACRCPLCGKMLQDRSEWETHESNTCLAMLNGDYFDSDRPFRWQCSYCDKMFHHRRDKNIHERVHTGEKPYTCGYCGRGFTQSQTLTIHIRTHTGEKPYPCGICGQEFRDSSALRKHEYRHATVPSSMVSSLYEDSAIEIEVGDDERSSWNGGNLTS
ncbi:hypothetical protein KIN20_020922 [Parelaphostrongylus tenuis]|uniref:C2H2-type domain-containing protein n=1 Tax=Parelaphostrongylus tenuis TaxID=148309 RepID=A0AAD5N4N8_PARTN|nr:hypothetical protein KIN20_020922 [Parelaphostrongylus tenuis]